MKDNMTRNEQLTLFDEMSFYEHVEDLINDYESSDLEFKSTAGGFPDNFWETYSAFANTQGGIIVLGVSEKKGRFIVDGLGKEQIVKYKKDFYFGSSVHDRAMDFPYSHITIFESLSTFPVCGGRSQLGQDVPHPAAYIV